MNATATFPTDENKPQGFSVTAVEFQGNYRSSTYYYGEVNLGLDKVWEHRRPAEEYPGGLADFAEHTMLLFTHRLYDTLAEPNPRRVVHDDPTGFSETHAATVASAKKIQDLAAIIRTVDGDHTLGAAALAEAIVEEHAAWEPCPHCAATVSAER